MFPFELDVGVLFWRQLRERGDVTVEGGAALQLDYATSVHAAPATVTQINITAALNTINFITEKIDIWFQAHQS